MHFIMPVSTKTEVGVQKPLHLFTAPKDHLGQYINMTSQGQAH